MNNKVDVKQLILKTKQYEFSDGLRDIQLGAIFLLMGLIWFGFMFTPFWLGLLISLQNSVGAWAKWIVLFSVFFTPVLFAVAGVRLMDYVRRRWLWRQSGMVKSSRRLVSQSTSIASAAIFIITLMGGLYLQPILKTGQFYIWSLIFLAASWSFGLNLTWFGVRIKINRYVFMGLIGGLASTVILLFQDSLGTPALIFTLGWGGLLITSGLINLIRIWPDVQVSAHGR